MMTNNVEASHLAIVTECRSICQLRIKWAPVLLLAIQMSELNIYPTIEKCSISDK